MKKVIQLWKSWTYTKNLLKRVKNIIMSRILNGFNFKLCTAFYNPNKQNNLGYVTILDKGLESTKINFLVDGKPCVIEINEDEFINDILEIKIDEWNNRGYEDIHEDAWMWQIEILYDDKKIISGGIGGFPKDFSNFMDLLHDKYGLTYSQLDKVIRRKGKEFKTKWWHRGTKIIPYSEIVQILNISLETYSLETF